MVRAATPGWLLVFRADSPARSSIVKMAPWRHGERLQGTSVWLQTLLERLNSSVSSRMNLLSPVSVCRCAAVWVKSSRLMIPSSLKGLREQPPNQRPLRGSEKYLSGESPGKSSLPCPGGPETSLNTLNTDRVQRAKRDWFMQFSQPELNLSLPRESHTSLSLFNKPGDLFQGDKWAWVPVVFRASAVGWE